MNNMESKYKFLVPKLLSVESQPQESLLSLISCIVGEFGPNINRSVKVWEVEDLLSRLQTFQENFELLLESIQQLAPSSSKYVLQSQVHGQKMIIKAQRDILQILKSKVQAAQTAVG